MRLLHTSDWHLGRSLHRADLREAQAAFLDHVVETVRAEKVDVVLVAGDVFDRAVPSVEAIELCEEALVRLRATGARVVGISGNHDSARRLGFGSRLADAAGVHLRTRPDAVAAPLVVEDPHGPVAIYAVPYLEPEAVREALPPPDDGSAAGRSSAAALGRATALARADLAKRRIPRSVVLSHAWVTGGTTSESERDISVGGVGCVPSELYDGFTYAALGHLHAPQVLRPHLRYSGSPLPYSFSEARQRKGSWLVELDQRGLACVEAVPAPALRRLAVLRGTLDALLASPAFAAHTEDFLSVTLTDAVRPEAAMDRLRARFPFVLVLSWEPEGVPDDGRDYGVRVRGRDDVGIATEFVAHVRRSPASAEERSLLTAALDAARRAADPDHAEGRAVASDDGAGARSSDRWIATGAIEHVA